LRYPIFFQTVPISTSYRVAELLLAMLYRLSPKLRRRVEENINTCFGDSYKEAKRRVLYQHFSQYHSWFSVDMLIRPNRMKSKATQCNVDLCVTLEALRDVSRNGEKGVLLVSSHQGSPDLITLSLGSHGLPVAVIARKLDDPFLLAESWHANEMPFTESKYPRLVASDPHSAT
jgi:lauroyl/myristoyl acyltransferase